MKVHFEQIGIHSFFLSVLLHGLFIFLFFYQEMVRYEIDNKETNGDFLEKDEKIIIRLKDKDKEIKIESPFLSSVNKEHQGKINDEEGINVLGNRISSIDIFKRQENNGFDIEFDKSEDKKKKIETNKKLIEKKKSSSVIPSPSVITENTRELKLNINDRARFSIGAKSDAWSKFYLSYVDAIEESFIQFASRQFLMGNAEVIVDTEVGITGKIYFKNFLKKEKVRPALNFIGEKMIEYSKNIKSIPEEIYKETSNDDRINVKVRIRYMSSTGYWWLYFE